MPTAPTQRPNPGPSFQPGNSPAHQYEVAIVGAGPIGIELAVYLKRAGVNYVHFDAKQNLIPGLAESWRTVDDKNARA